MKQKRWAEMTPEERQAAIDLHERLQADAEAVKAYEAALDRLAAYLKEARRARTAPTMLYQYPRFELREFRRLVAEVERKVEAHQHLNDALHRRAEAAS